jgi:hypothetical protein
MTNMEMRGSARTRSMARFWIEHNSGFLRRKLKDRTELIGR